MSADQSPVRENENQNNSTENQNNSTENNNSTEPQNNSTDPYSIAVFQGQKGNKGQWQNIGQVCGNAITYVDQEARLGDLKLLAVHERRLLSTIMETETSMLNEPLLYCVETKDEKEILSSYLIDVMHFRRGTVYIMVQSSNKGVRLLSYATNKKHHSATCFWTSPMDNLSQTELESRMTTAMKNLNKNPYIPKTVCELIQAGFVEFHC